MGSLLKPGTEQNDGGTFRPVLPTKIWNSQLVLSHAWQKSSLPSAICEHAAW